MKNLTIRLAAGVALGTAISWPALAISVDNLAAASRELATSIHKVAYVCGPYQCWWQPDNYYSYYSFYSPPVYVAPYGYYGPVWYRPGLRGYRRAWRWW